MPILPMGVLPCAVSGDVWLVAAGGFDVSGALALLAQPATASPAAATTIESWRLARRGPHVSSRMSVGLELGWASLYPDTLGIPHRGTTNLTTTLRMPIAAMGVGAGW